MITNYIPNTCKYSVNNLKKVVHIFSESENVIHIDNGEAYVSSGITDFQTIYATSVDFAESTSYDDRFKFEKQITVTVDGFLKLDSLNEKYYLVLEDENHTMWLVNADFPSFVTYTYTLSEGVDETIFTFNVLSNFPTLKLNAKINNSYECKDYSLANVKELKMNLKENCTIDHVNHIIYDSSNTPYYIVKFNEGTLKMEESYDGFNVTTTIQFNINFDNYKASWHYNLLEYQDNKYVAVTDHLACGFDMGLIPSYNVQGSSQKGQGDIVTIRLVGTSQRGSEWAEEWTEATLIPDYVWLLTEEWTCYTPPVPPTPPPAFEGKYKFTFTNSSVVSAECDSSSAVTHDDSYHYRRSAFTAVIGDCVTTLPPTGYEGAFHECIGLTSVYMSDSVTTIGYRAFYWCRNLSNINISTGATYIGKEAFAYCRSLTNIDIPNSVTSIDESVFLDCESLSSATLSNNLTSISNKAFEQCYSLTSIDIPNSVTSVGQQAFSGCYSLTSVTIGTGVTTIGNHAFYQCTGLTSIELPDSITSISGNAFESCSGLSSITCLAPTPPSLGDYVFYDTNDCPIYVPSGSVNTYKSAWPGYASRIQSIL